MFRLFRTVKIGNSCSRDCDVIRRGFPETAFIKYKTTTTIANVMSELETLWEADPEKRNYIYLGIQDSFPRIPPNSNS